MHSSTSAGNLNGFYKSLDELSHFADSLKLHDQELEQKHRLELDKLKSGFELQTQLEKDRFTQLQEYNRSKTEDLRKETKERVDLEHQLTVMKTKYDCVAEELKQIKDQHEQKKARLERSDKIINMFANDKVKFEEEIQQLRKENERLKEKLKELPLSAAASIPTTPTTTITTASSHGIPEELIPLVQQAIAENQALKKSLSDREKELQTLQEQIDRMHSEDPQVVEQRLLQMVSKLKSDFGLMYRNQATFFLEKIDLLKQEQRDNIASLYRH